MKILSTIEHFRYKLVIPVINLFKLREKSISPVSIRTYKGGPIVARDCIMAGSWWLIHVAIDKPAYLRYTCTRIASQKC